LKKKKKTVPWPSCRPRHNLNNANAGDHLFDGERFSAPEAFVLIYMVKTKKVVCLSGHV
jgi:hypothetical protein